MTTFSIQELPKVNFVTELEDQKSSTIKGGIAPAVAAGLFIAASGVIGLTAGYGITYVLDNAGK